MIRALMMAFALTLPAVASAQPQLVASTPAKDATVAPPKTISLRFSEAIETGVSGFTLVMTGMPGMADHPPMPIRGFTTKVGADGNTLVAALPRALPVGSYDLRWSVVGADARSAEGVVAFRVR